MCYCCSILTIKTQKLTIINLVFHPVWIITDISTMLLKHCYEPNHICTFQTLPPHPPFSLIRSVHFISSAFARSFVMISVFIISFSSSLLFWGLHLDLVTVQMLHRQVTHFLKILKKARASGVAVTSEQASDRMSETSSTVPANQGNVVGVTNYQ